MHIAGRACSPYEEQGRRPRPTIRPYEIADLAARLNLNTLEAEALQQFGRTLLSQALAHIDYADVEAGRIRYIAASLRRQHRDMAVPSRGGRHAR